MEKELPSNSKDLNLKLVIIRELAKGSMTIPIVLLILVLPYFTSIVIPNYQWVALVSLIALVSAVCFPLFHFSFHKKGKLEQIKRLLSFEVVFDTALISLFLLLFPEFARPLFIVYGFIIIGASYTYNLSLPYSVALVGSLYLTINLILQLSAGQQLSIYDWLDLLMRFSFLILMAYFSNVLAESVLTEKRQREKAEGLAENLEKSETRVKEQLVELTQRHKFVSTMRRLDQIIMNTLELSEVAQKIVDTISWELGLGTGVIGILSKDGSVLNFLAISQTPETKKLLSGWDKPFSTLVLQLTNSHYNLCQKVLEQRRSITTNSLGDIFHQILPLGEVGKIQKALRVESCLVYPISAKGKAVGVLVFLMREPYDSLTAQNFDILDAFADETGIAIESALLYSDLKEANTQLTRTYEDLKALDKMKDDLIAITSHELRTPLTEQRNYLWMILNRKKDQITDPKILEYLTNSYQSTERMIKLVDDTLTVSQIEGGNMQLKLTPAPLEPIIEKVITGLNLTAKGKGVELIFLKSPAPLSQLNLDSEKIQQVLENLIGNALKYTPQGGKVTVETLDEKDLVKVTVTDTGIGIDPNDLPRMFKKFGRLDTSLVTVAEAGGTGLGLYICKGIIELHGGEIGVESEVGGGSRFWFTLRKVQS